jgi:hypothetical protein
VSFAWGELDHIILFCDAGAPEADALKERGLHEGPPNSHPGQGTANRRFFFPNLYLELVWVENPIEAQSEVVRPTHIWDRWSQRQNGPCPFGLVLRPGGRREVNTIPSWTYAPRYFPPGFSIEVAQNVPANEPLLFYLPFARPALVEDIRSPSAHHAHVGSIVGATLHLPETAALSPALQALVTAGVVAVEPAREYLLDLFHVGGTTELVDMRPELALRFRPARRASDAKH